jgi:peptidoglycan/xylan/chitin deacetylase (PgdA/CDA1 family)
VTRVLIAHPASYPAERRYACEVVLEEFLGFDVELRVEARCDWELTVAGLEGRLRMPDVFFAIPPARWLTASSLPGDDGALAATPVPYLAAATYQRQQPTLDLDVFGNAFFFLTRYEEAALDERDEHDRFPADASWAGRNNLLTRPLVNEYVDALWRAMQREWPGLERRPREFRLQATHDVDWPHVTRGRTLRQVARAAAGDAVRLREPGLGTRRLAAWARVRAGDFSGDPGNTFDFLLAESERRGLRSAFYFISGRTAGEIDGCYDLEDRPIRDLLRKVSARGHEVGLHSSYGSYLDPCQLSHEFARLRAVCRREGAAQAEWGARQHYLRWRTPDTARYLSQAGLCYDATLGFATRAGFRAAVCYEYPLFDLETGRKLRLRERPLVAMEMTVFADTSQRYMNLPRLEALDYMRTLRDAVRRHGGTFTLLWHNSTLLSKRQQNLYRETLDLLTARDG